MKRIARSREFAHERDRCRNPMKPLIVIITAAAFLCSLSAHGRVGETEKEIAARYGEGKRADNQRIPGAVTSAYTKEVVILDGKSVLEIFARKGGTTEAAIQELLPMNSLPDATWRFDKKANRWERSGTPKLVAYRWPGHPEFFCIKNLKAYWESTHAIADWKANAEHRIAQVNGKQRWYSDYQLRIAKVERA